MSQDTSHDRLKELAALYLAGALSPQERQRFEAELEAGGEGSGELRDLDDVARALVEAVDPVEPKARIREALLARARGEAASTPAPGPLERPIWRRWEDQSDEDLFTLRSGEGEWKETGVDGVYVRRLFVDRAANRMTALFRMEPGASYPQHVHAGPEECYVLEGDLHVGDAVLRAGDYQRAVEGSLHGIQSTEGGCLLLVTSSLTDEHVS